MSEFFHQLPIISTVGLVLIFGFLGSRIARKIGLPSVTGYIFAGMAIGKSLLGWVVGEPDSTTALFLDNISIAALGLIAFSIGSELHFSKLKQLGKEVVPIALSESLGALLLVSGSIAFIAWLFPGLLFTSASFVDVLPLALILGAISTATAPAATIAVINEYRARGPLTDTLIATVALDDGFCIMIFGLVFPVALAVAGGVDAGVGLTFSGIILVPLREILFSLGLGALVGLAISRLLRFIPGRGGHLIIIFGFILLLSGVAEYQHLSPLLTNMAFGFLLTNLSGKNSKISGALATIEPPLFVAFFTIAGIHLDLRLVAGVGILGALYFLSRIAGKSGGAALGAYIVKAPPLVRRYLGLGLLPQAGVAIGLVILVGDHPLLKTMRIDGRALPDIITNCILATVALNELIGPLAAKLALRLAGAIKGGEDENRRSS